MHISYAVEGQTDAAVARRMIEECGLTPGPEFVLGGKGRLDQRLPNYNRAAAFGLWLVLRDLDRQFPCPIGLVNFLVPNRHTNLLLRIPIHAVETWLLADREAFAAFFRVRLALIPKSPEQLPDPKRAVIDLARVSRSRDVQRGIPPTITGGRSIGPLYVSMLTDFVRTHWSAQRAGETGSVPSLQRTLDRLRALV